MLKCRSLGSAAAAARGLTISGATNATPIVVTLGADNRLRLGERIGVFGVTGNTGANGIWTYRYVSATTGSLDGSAGNGAATLTNAVIATINDKTPFMRNHDAVVHVAQATDQIAPDLTFAIMGNKSDATDAEILATDATALATYFEDMVSGQDAFTVPGATNDGINEMRNVTLRRWMYLNVSAYTAGGLIANLLA